MSGKIGTSMRIIGYESKNRKDFLKRKKEISILKNKQRFIRNVYKINPDYFEEFYKTHEKYHCSSCKKIMSYKTAKAQIENKRENAPICVGCIINK